MILFLYIVIVLVHFDVDFQRSCSIAWEVAWCSDCLFDFRYCVMLGALCLPTYAYHWNCWFGKSKQAMPGSVRLLSMLLQLRDRSRYQIGWILGTVPNSSWPPTPTPQNGPYFWKSCACISYYPAIIYPRIYATICVIQNLQYNFPKMKEGGSKAVWNFSKSTFDLVAPPFPVRARFQGLVKMLKVIFRQDF